MMSTGAIVFMTVIWTLLVAAMVEFADVSGGVVPAVAVAWFSLGCLVGRSERRITKWGRQS